MLWFNNMMESKYSLYEGEGWTLLFG
jgi:hypothetical protein